MEVLLRCRQPQLGVLVLLVVVELELGFRSAGLVGWPERLLVELELPHPFFVKTGLLVPSGVAVRGFLI